MCVQSNTLLLVNVSENFRNAYLEIPALVWPAALKRIKPKLDLLTDIDALLMVKKGIRGGLYHSIYWYAKS